jgi:small-conductance mechanosensitive channel
MRKWRGIPVTLLTGICALVIVGVAGALGNVHGDTRAKVLAFVCTVAFLVIGLIAVRSAADDLARHVLFRNGQAARAAVRMVLTILGYLIVLVVALSLLGVSFEHFLLGGTIAGIVIGIAAQQSLGNMFAGLVLMFARPFHVGEHVRIRSGSLAGEFDGVITEMSLTYVSLDTADGPLKVPNSGVLAAAVGHWTPKTPFGQ